MTDPPILDEVSIRLSGAQVDQVVGAASNGSAIRHALSGLVDARIALELDAGALDDTRLSRTLLTGLLVLVAFPSDRSYVGNTEMAETLGTSKATTHRYISTLVAAGLVERDPDTRKYRLAR